MIQTGAQRLFEQREHPASPSMPKPASWKKTALWVSTIASVCVSLSFLAIFRSPLSSDTSPRLDDLKRVSQSGGRRSTVRLQQVDVVQYWRRNSSMLFNVSTAGNSRMLNFSGSIEIRSDGTLSYMKDYASSIELPLSHAPNDSRAILEEFGTDSGTLGLALHRVPDLPGSSSRPLINASAAGSKVVIPFEGRLRFPRMMNLHGSPNLNLEGHLDCYTVADAGDPLVCDNLQAVPIDSTLEWAKVNISNPEPVAMISSFALSSSASLRRACFRLVEIEKSGGGQTSCPTTSAITNLYDNCCLDVVTWTSATVLNSSFEAMPISGPLLTAAIAAVSSDTIPSGASCVDDIVHDVFCADTISDNRQGYAVLAADPDVILIDSTASELLLAHEMSHLFDITHSDWDCFGGDIADPDSLAWKLTDYHCSIVDQSLNARDTGLTCTANPDTC